MKQGNNQCNDNTVLIVSAFCVLYSKPYCIQSCISICWTPRPLNTCVPFKTLMNSIIWFCCFNKARSILIAPMISGLFLLPREYKDEVPKIRIPQYRNRAGAITNRAVGRAVVGYTLLIHKHTLAEHGRIPKKNDTTNERDEHGRNKGNTLENT